VGNAGSNALPGKGKKAPYEGVFPKKLNLAGTCILPSAPIYLIYIVFSDNCLNLPITIPRTGLFIILASCASVCYQSKHDVQKTQYFAG
jgi:hypothetical protein